MYKTPEGFSDIIINGDGKYLTGLWWRNKFALLAHEGNDMKKYFISK